MLTLRDGIVELYKKVATSLPKDVEDAIQAAQARLTSTGTMSSLSLIPEAIITSRTSATPLCIDTGFPTFYVKAPKGLSHQHIREVILEATRAATERIPLRPSAVNGLTGENSGDNVGELFPLIYVEETEKQSLTIDLMLRGGDSQTLGRTYQLPDTLELPELGSEEPLPVVAEQNLQGVKLCILDAIRRALGKGCPPFTIGVAVGGARDQVTCLSKRQLLRKITDTNQNPVLAQFEAEALRDIGEFFGQASGPRGRAVALAVKAAVAHRLPESFFVDISFACWANRRGRLIW